MKRLTDKKTQRKLSVRAKLGLEKLKIRLSVFRSNKYIYAQMVDVSNGKTLGTVRDKKPENAGQMIAEKAIKNKISEVVFDRGAYKYHGRVKKLADAARDGGLKF